MESEKSGVLLRSIPITLLMWCRNVIFFCWFLETFIWERGVCTGVLCLDLMCFLHFLCVNFRFFIRKLSISKIYLVVYVSYSKYSVIAKVGLNIFWKICSEKILHWLNVIMNSLGENEWTFFVSKYFLAFLEHNIIQ